MLWVLIRFALFLHKNICCGCSLESPRSSCYLFSFHLLFHFCIILCGGKLFQCITFWQAQTTKFWRICDMSSDKMHPTWINFNTIFMQWLTSLMLWKHSRWKWYYKCIWGLPILRKHFSCLRVEVLLQHLSHKVSEPRLTPTHPHQQHPD